MNTKRLTSNNIDIAADIIKNGGLVAIPTETVYGLAANALDGKAVSKIFKAKGRPMDNPLIVHVSCIEEIDKLVSEIPPQAKKLANTFWPGPLTIILKRSNIIPAEVSAGLDTVAIRLPNNDVTRKLIKIAGVPLAAPSANTSGSPSPTSANHVLHDLDGKIDAILDAGNCRVGLESTVITLTSPVPTLLRPGGITVEELRNVLGNVEIDKAVIDKVDSLETVSSPGMKYKHYSPETKIIIVDGDNESFIKYVNSRSSDKVAALCYIDDQPKLNVKTVTFGKMNDYNMQANELFSALRKIDDLNVNIVYARCPQKNGVGLAVYNRLIRAAGFEVIKLG